MKFSNREQNGQVYDYSDPFTIPDLLESITSGKYGSVTKDVEALVARKTLVFNSLFTMCPDLEWALPSAMYNRDIEVSGKKINDVVDLERSETKSIIPTTDVYIIDSDEEDVNRRPLNYFQEISFPRPLNTLELHAQSLLVRLFFANHS